MSARQHSVYNVSTLTTHVVVVAWMLAVVDRLMGADKHGFFRRPVDPEKLGLVDYFRRVKRPMDFGTVRARLARGAYASNTEAEADLRQALHNALVYNDRGTLVYQCALQLRVLLDAEMKRLEPPRAVDAQDELKLMRARLQQLEAEMTVLNRGAPPAPKMPRLVPTAPAHAPLYRTPPVSRGIVPSPETTSYLERRRLAKEIEGLGDEKLRCVVELVQDRFPEAVVVSPSDPDEIEMDFGKLDLDALRALRVEISTII